MNRWLESKLCRFGKPHRAKSGACALSDTSLLLCNIKLIIIIIIIIIEKQQGSFGQIQISVVISIFSVPQDDLASLDS